MGPPKRMIRAPEPHIAGPRRCGVAWPWENEFGRRTCIIQKSGSGLRRLQPTKGQGSTGAAGPCSSSPQAPNNIKSDEGCKQIQAVLPTNTTESCRTALLPRRRILPPNGLPDSPAVLQRFQCHIAGVTDWRCAEPEANIRWHIPSPPCPQEQQQQR